MSSYKLLLPYYTITRSESGKASGTLMPPRRRVCFMYLLVTPNARLQFLLFEKRKLRSSGYLVNDSLTVECTITVLHDLDATDREQPLPVPPPSDLHQHLGELLQSSDGADVTFHVSEESFTTHKIFLAARSPVFKVEFIGGMKEALLLWRSKTWRLLCSGPCFTSSIPTWPQSSMVTRSMRRRRPSLSTYW
jgi:hypothetical protein